MHHLGFKRPNCRQNTISECVGSDKLSAGGIDQRRSIGVALQPQETSKDRNLGNDSPSNGVIVDHTAPEIDSSDQLEITTNVTIMIKDKRDRVAARRKRVSQKERISKEE